MLLAVAGSLAALGVAGAAVAIRDPVACSGPPLVRSADAGPPPSAATTGQLLVAHDRSGDASIVDLATGEVSYVEIGLDEPHEVAVSDDGRWGVMSDFGAFEGGKFLGNKVAVIDMAAKRLARVIDLGELRGAHGVAFVPGDSRRALVTTQTSRRLVELDVVSGTVVRAMDTGADGSHIVATSRDGRSAYTANEGNGTVSRFDLATRARTAQFRIAPERVEGLAVTPDGDGLWVGSDVTRRVYILNAGDGVVRDSLPGFLYPNRIVIPAQGGRALIADAGCVHVADLGEPRLIGDLVGVSGSFAVSPDGAVAFFASSGREVVVVDVERRLEIVRHRLRARGHGVAWGVRPQERSARPGVEPMGSSASRRDGRRTARLSSWSDSQRGDPPREAGSRQPVRRARRSSAGGDGPGV